MRLILLLSLAGTLLIPAAAQEQDAAVQTFLNDMRAAALQRQSVESLYESGFQHLAAGSYREAEDAFRKVYQQEPGSARGIEGVAQVYLAQNRKQEALQLMQSQVDNNPTRTDILMAFVDIASKAGEDGLAVTALNKALENSGAGSAARGTLYLQLGAIYQRQNDVKSSIDALQEARVLLPADIKVAAAPADALETSGQHYRATEVYRAILGVDASDGRALQRRAADLSDSRDDLDLALTCARLAKQLLPDAPEVTDTLGFIYLRKGMPSEAIQAFEELVAQDAANATYHYHLGLALMQTGARPRALTELKEALELDPRSPDQERINTLIATLTAGK